MLQTLSGCARSATSIAELDNGETIWELNLVLTTEPSEGEEPETDSGAHLCLPLAMRDFSGPLRRYIRAGSSQTCSVVDPVEFLQVHAENHLRFPVVASLKLLRKRKKTSAAQPDHVNAFDCFIVDARERDMQEALPLQSTTWLPMVDTCVDVVLATAPKMVRKPEHYAMAVEYVTQQCHQSSSSQLTKR